MLLPKLQTLHLERKGCRPHLRQTLNSEAQLKSMMEETKKEADTAAKATQNLLKAGMLTLVLCFFRVS